MRARHLNGIAAGLRSFGGVEHRLEFVRERNGVTYYNDSKATNVDATEKAIDAFPGNFGSSSAAKTRIAITPVLRDKVRAKAKGILLIGAAAPIIAGSATWAALAERGCSGQAVRDATLRATPGDIFYLHLACASFDQFDNFEHRGRVFKEVVRSL